MAPRGYDRYMVVIGAGRNRKFVRFTDSERCAHFLGVLSIAAQAPSRGYLLISSGHEAGPEEVANESSVPLRVARSTLEKLKRVGVLLRDEEVGAWRVHDWDHVNPPPGSSTDRVRRFRAGKRNGDVTNNETESVSNSLHSALPEGEGEVEVEESSSPTAQKTTRKRVTHRVDQSVPPDDFPADRVPDLTEVSSVLHRAWDVRGGVEPSPRGVALGMLRNLRADHAQIARQLEHWLTAGRGARSKCGDIAARYGDWVADAPAADRSGAVVPMQSPRRKSDAWADWYDQRDAGEAS